MVTLRLNNSISGSSLDHCIEFMMDFIPKKDSPPRITCRYRKCPASFTRKTDARRHERQVHQPAKIFCKFSGCRFRGTVRAEVMRRHLKSKHPFDVESIFQLDNDNLGGRLPKVKIPREFSSSNDKVDFFSNRRSHPLPAISQGKIHKGSEHTTGRHIKTGHNDFSENFHLSNNPEEMNFGSFTPTYGGHNRSSLEISQTPRSQATAILAPENSLIHYRDKVGDSGQPHFGCPIGLWFLRTTCRIAGLRWSRILNFLNGANFYS